MQLQEALGGADTHTTMSGVAHRAFENDIEALRATREFFDFLPLNSREKPPTITTEDTRERREESLRYICPDDPNQPYDMLEVIKKVRIAIHDGRMKGRRGQGREGEAQTGALGGSDCSEGGGNNQAD